MTTAFGTALKDVLTAHRLSQSRAAELADCDTSYVSRLVSGARMPTREFIDRLVSNCGLSDEEWDRLLVAAGFIPHDVTLLDPELQDAAAALADEAIPLSHRLMLRLQISALVGITRQMAA